MATEWIPRVTEPRRVFTDPQPGGRATIGRILSRMGEPLAEDRVLVWHDEWRNRDRVLRWQGPCLGCARQTWAFDDGENDPRGILGDAALWTVIVEDRMGIEVEVRACAICANDYTAATRVASSAAYRGIRTAIPYNFGAGVPYQIELVQAWGLATEE